MFTVPPTGLLLADNKPSNGELVGIVTDADSHLPLIGCTVYLLDLKTGTITDADGKYFISNIPDGKFLIQVSFVGYQTESRYVMINDKTSLNIILKSSAIEMSEVVVTGSAGSSDIKRSSVSVVALKGKELLLSPSTNLVNLLISVPGVAAITTGGAVSKPVIRGLSSNHVVTLNEGVRQEGNQWGDEHGIEIDQFSVDRIEILKGPSSLFYGSDALGGVINILEPVPAHQGHIHGEIILQYSTNNKLAANSIMGEGNQNGIIWKLRGTLKSAATFQTPVEYIYNSGFNEKNISGLLGINRSWGFSHIHFSSYDSKIGVIDALRDSVTEKFVDTSNKIVPDNILEGRLIQLPFQKVTHQKISIVNSFDLKGMGQLKLNGGYQNNNRKEFSSSSENPDLFFHLNTITYDIRYLLKEKNNWEPAFGISGMSQKNENKGYEFLIPDYTMNDLGGFAYLKKSMERLTFNGGLRYDIRKIKVRELLRYVGGQTSVVFEGFNTIKAAISGAVGFTYNINTIMDVKANLGRGFRAPNIAELSANGVHEGTYKYEIGNAMLNPETSMQLDGEFSTHTRNISIVISGFYNNIHNYIYERNLDNEAITIDKIVFPVYRFVQGNSILTGGEVSSDIHPIDKLHIENNFAFVYAQNKKLKSPLPLIPPGKSEHAVKWILTPGKGKLQNSYIKADLNLVFKQSRIDYFETSTSGYALFNASAGSEFNFGRIHAIVFISANNLFNKKYFDHLNRLKYLGILNPGRNITFGLNIPLELVGDK